MVTGLLLLAACVGLVVVAFWVAQNDGVAPGQPTRGILAMRDAADDDPASPGGDGEGSAQRPGSAARAPSRDPGSR